MPEIADQIVTDNGKQRVETGKRGQITRFFYEKLEYTPLGLLIIYRLVNDRDMKIIITSKGKTTGTGKTTLAIILAKWIKQVSNEIFGYTDEWNAEEYAFMDVTEYLQKYAEAKKGDILISDELEVMADKRRFMSDQNVKFSQAWSMLRYKNVVTIGTAPGPMDLEKRVMETADIWINVVHLGRANVYYLTVDDFEWKPISKRLKAFGFKQTILFNSLKNDSDYEYLKSEKEDYGVPGIDDMGEKIDESYVKDKLSSRKTKTVKELVKSFDEKGKIYEDGQGIKIEDLSTYELSEISGWSQQKVSNIIRDMKKNGEILNDK